MSDHAPLIDFHAHILPGADHGSSGTEESLNQLTLMYHAGVDTVVATPHFYPNRHRIEDHLRKIASSAEKLANRPMETPRICLGAEVLHCEGLENMEGLDLLCIRGTKVLLLELPMSEWNTELFDTVDALLHSYTVVLAHIDRYVRENTQEIKDLLSMGAWAQINTDVFSYFGERRKIAPFLACDRVVALGSDLHNVNRKTYERFLAAKKRLGSAYDEIMLRTADLLKTAETI